MITENEFQKKYLHYQNWLYTRIEKNKKIKLTHFDKLIIKNTIEETIQFLSPEYKQRELTEFGQPFMLINFEFLEKYHLSPF